MPIRLATLNAWALPEPLARAVPERMHAIGTRLADLGLDAIALQEVWTAEARAILVEAGRGAGLGHVWHNPATLGGSGLLLMSRLPIAAARFERFSLPRVPARPDHPDYYGGKGFATLELATSQGPLLLIATHLQARYGSDVPHEYRAYRVGQIVELATALRRVRVPVVVAGDFNLRERDPEYRILGGLTGLRDAAAEAGRPEATVLPGSPFRGGTRRARRVDFVFLRDGDRRGLRVHGSRRIFDEVFDVAGRPTSCSDHAGVLAELTLAPDPTPRRTPSAEAFRLASRYLAEGRARAERDRRTDRALAGLGWGAALLACAGVRAPRVTRRRLLRAGLQGLGIAALTPGVGYSLLSEVFAPDELRVFRQLESRLLQVRGGAPGGST